MPKTPFGVWVVLLALSGCTKTAEPPTKAKPLPATAAVEAMNLWHCAEHTSFKWRYVDETAEHIDLQVGNASVQRLSKRPAGLHNTFSDGVLAFELQGAQARLYQVPSGKHVGYDCKAQ